jgi:hypothetical protein
MASDPSDETSATNAPVTNAPKTPTRGWPGVPNKPFAPYKPPPSREEKEAARFEEARQNPANRPDLEFWFGRKIWSSREAAAIILNFDPHKVPPDERPLMSVKPLPRSSLADYAELVRRFDFAVHAGLLPQHFTPVQALNFAAENKYVQLSDLLHTWLEQNEKQKTVSAITREKNTVLKLLAIVMYSGRTVLTNKELANFKSKIYKDAESSGLTMDHGTMGKHVDQAYSDFPPSSA